MIMYSERMKNLVRKGQKMFVGYLLAGYPTNEEFLEVLSFCDEIDIVEIGFPSANPYADGEAIQNAHRSVHRESVCNLNYWREIRNRICQPIWIMAYQEDFITSGICLEFARNRLMDGVVIPDADNQDELSEILRPYGVDVIPTVNPGMSKEELEKTLKKTSLLYEQLYVGKTGEVNPHESYMEMLKYTMQYPDVIKFGGFGINSPKKVDEVLKNGFEGVIIGSELIRRLSISKKELKQFLRDIGKVVRQ